MAAMIYVCALFAFEENSASLADRAPLIVDSGHGSGGEICIEGDGGGRREREEDGVRVVCIPELAFAQKAKSCQVRLTPIIC